MAQARQLYQARRAAQVPVPRKTDFIDKILNETLDRLRGGVADEGWWQRICDGIGRAFVAPDFFRIDAVREWLASEQVPSDLRNLARAAS